MKILNIINLAIIFSSFSINAKLNVPIDNIIGEIVKQETSAYIVYFANISKPDGMISCTKYISGPFAGKAHSTFFMKSKFCYGPFRNGNQLLSESEYFDILKYKYEEQEKDVQARRDIASEKKENSKKNSESKREKSR